AHVRAGEENALSARVVGAAVERRRAAIAEEDVERLAADGIGNAVKADGAFDGDEVADVEPARAEEAEGIRGCGKQNVQRTAADHDGLIDGLVGLVELKANVGARAEGGSRDLGLAGEEAGDAAAAEHKGALSLDERLVAEGRGQVGDADVGQRAAEGGGRLAE